MSCMQIALVEVELDGSIPSSLFVAFSICTTLVVAIHLVALLISTCILPNLEAATNIRNYYSIDDSSHEQMHWYIELAWILSTGFGIILFLLQMALLTWVRFLPYSVTAPAVSTAIIIPLLGLFIIFAFHFYRRLVAHQYELATKNLEEVQMLACELEGVSFETTDGKLNDVKPVGPSNMISV